MLMSVPTTYGTFRLWLSLTTRFAARVSFLMKSSCAEEAPEYPYALEAMMCPRPSPTGMSASTHLPVAKRLWQTASSEGAMTTGAAGPLHRRAARLPIFTPSAVAILMGSEKTKENPPPTACALSHTTSHSETSVSWSAMTSWSSARSVCSLFFSPRRFCETETNEKGFALSVSEAAAVGAVAAAVAAASSDPVGMPPPADEKAKALFEQDPARLLQTPPQ